MPDDFKHDVILRRSAKDKAVVRPLAGFQRLLGDAVFVRLFIGNVLVALLR